MKEIQAAIERQRMIRDQATAEIDRIAKAHIPDFHFLDHRVSTFWKCDRSPIGWCVFNLRVDNGYRIIETTCRYCGGPVERK